MGSNLFSCGNNNGQMIQPDSNLVHYLFSPLGVIHSQALEFAVSDGRARNEVDGTEGHSAILVPALSLDSRFRFRRFKCIGLWLPYSKKKLIEHILNPSSSSVWPCPQLSNISNWVLQPASQAKQTRFKF